MTISSEDQETRVGKSTKFCLCLCLRLPLLLHQSSHSRVYGSSAKISYNDHCGSVLPESNSTVRAQVVHDFPFLPPEMSYYTGGEKILGKTSFPNSVNFLSNSNTSHPLKFFVTKNVYETNTPGIYKVQAAYLKFQVRVFRREGDYSYSYGGEYRNVSRPFRNRQLKFLLNGFWSEPTGKLCMVGSASWRSTTGEVLQLEAVLKLSYPPKKSTIFTGMVKGSLESLSPHKDSSSYFQPIKIVSFPLIRNYSYTLASKEELNGGCLGGKNLQPGQFLSFKSKGICPYLVGTFDFALQYVSGCKGLENCNPLQRDASVYLPRAMSLSGMQCSEDEEKIRYKIEFSNSSKSGYYPSFEPKMTLIGEGSWQRKTNQMCIVACRILDSSTSFRGDANVGDCSIRLSLRFPAVWTINSTRTILGEIWTNNTVNSLGYFKMIKIRSLYDNGWRFPGLKYEYTELAKARNSCPKKKPAVKDGSRYPKADSNEMRFQISINHHGEVIGRGDVVPLSIGDDIYQGHVLVLSEPEEEGHAEIISEDVETSNSTSPMNISYRISFNDMTLKGQVSSLNYSLDPRDSVEISAEGVYDGERGLLCMVGCREIYSYNHQVKQSQDCEILINFQFPPVNAIEGSSYIEGTIQSRRKETDPLYFEKLNISSYFFSSFQAKESIWRMDLEIILVLISSSLACIFVVLQIFYVKKHPEKLPFISLSMLTILTLGHFIPLVLNFEALISKNQYQQNVILKGSGWLEVNEMSVRLVTMVAFLLILRLLQLAWTSRLNEGNHKHHSWTSERRVLYLSLPLYIAGGFITLLVSLKKNGNPYRLQEAGFDIDQQSSTLNYLRSYAGLIVDGFLFPQILLNMFQSSKESVLSLSFYMGTTLVRLLPHAYDLYRIHNFVHEDFGGGSAYIYANPNADFYSIVWDVIILCGCILFAMIIWLQQRFGGRCFLPRKLIQLESYEKVPVVNIE
ncbi:hypothetical protein M9H77_21898 [Catharanthus roseus]|uniref:Uncharacterized protein n=1 Tax=Catharanthus roseus TaxID=4058 RepID=A0ACC0ANX5_CATRO|nr:hypothetical protein M9H77_21898 [Catharanthus roseus]